MLKISINNILDPCKGIQDTPGFWIARHGFRIPLRYWMPVFVSGTRIPDLWIPKAQDYGFQEQNFPDFRFHKQDSLTWCEQ